MQLLKAVVTDLWSFVLEELSFRRSTASVTTILPSDTLPVSASTTPTPTPVTLPGTDVALSSGLESVTAVNEPDSTVSSSTPGQVSEVYTLYPETPCYLRPGQALDTMIGTIPYATALTILSRRDGWLQIRSDAVEGWVEQVMVTATAEAVLPSFVLDEEYDVDHPETLKLRTYIKDEFGGGVARMSLLSCEYVWYQLLRSGRDFSWPLTRPRTAGRWADILQGSPAVHVGSVPLTGGVMEYLDENGDAQLLHIKAVKPDESVVVAGIVPTPAGVYRQFTVAQTDWHALGARFINKK